MIKFVAYIGDNISLKPAISELKRYSDEMVTEWYGENYGLAIVHRKNDQIRHTKNNYYEMICTGDVELKLANNFNPNSIFPQLIDKSNGYLFIFNRSTNKFYIQTDYTFRKVVYLHEGDRTFVFSNEVKAIASLHIFTPIISWESVMTYIVFSGFYGRGTIFQDIYRMRTGIVAEFDMTIMLGYYIVSTFKYPKMYDRSIEPVDQDEISEMFIDVLNKLERTHGKMSIMLSGGLDSRMMLLYQLSREPEDPIDALTIYSNESNPDLVYSKFITKMNRVNHEGLESFPELLLRHVKDNAYICEGSSSIGTSIHAEIPVRIRYLNGHTGDIALGGSYYKLTSEEYNLEKLSDYVFRHSVTEWKLKKIIKRSSDWEEMKLVVERGLRRFVDVPSAATEIPKLTHDPQLIVELYSLNNRVACQMHTLAMENSELIFPFLESPFLFRCLQIDINERKNRKFQWNLMSNEFPEYAYFPSTSIANVEQKQSFYSKLKKIGKKIPIVRQFGRIIVHRKLAGKKENHYNPINTWARENIPFRLFIQLAISNFCEREEVNKYFNTSEIKKLYSKHVEKKQNNMGILQNIVNIELMIKSFEEKLGFDTI